MDWFAHFNGTASDPKWSSVARLAGCPKYQVYAVWCLLLEHASAARERGSVTGFDPESLGHDLGLDVDIIEAVVKALRVRKHITGDRITRWAERQPKRDKSAARMAKLRKAKAPKVTGGDASRAVTVTGGDGCDAGDGSRGEKSEALRSDTGSSLSPPSIQIPPSTRVPASEREDIGKSRGRDWIDRLSNVLGGKPGVRNA